MSVTPLTEYSLMDMLFDRVESIKTEKEEEEEEEEEADIKIEETNDGYWDNNSDDFLDSILFNQGLDFMTSNDIFVEEPSFREEVSGSVCSDSGVSSDQQFSPLSSHDLDDEPEFKSSHQREVCVEPEISVDPSVLNLLGDSDPKEDPLKQEKITLHKSDEESVKVTQTRPHSLRCKGSISKILNGTNTKVLNLASLQSHNPRSILIPVSIKGRGNVKTLKIIKAARKAPPAKCVRIKSEPADDSASTSDETDIPDSAYPRLQLTEEEKRLMVKEGISLPTHYPLTKQEERDLKRIRRKIRNKISAQDSRKRKKEYVDGLEDRVKQYSAENASLMKKVKALQSENQTLSAHLKRLQAVIAKGGASPHQANPSTCLMVLILSLALIMAPNMRGPRSHTPPDLSLDTPQQPSSPIAGGRSRALLETQKPSEKGFLEPPLDGGIGEEEKEAGILSELAELLRFRSSSHNDHDYTNAMVQPRKRVRGFIEPPLDDHWPPPKRPAVVVEERRRLTNATPLLAPRSHILSIKVAPDEEDM